jgi:hypothetical protein
MADPKEPQGVTPDPEPQPRVEQPTEKIEPAAEPVAETTSAAEAPAPPPPPQPTPVAAAPNAKFGRFARHRATGLVAAGLLGLVLGGGLVAAFDHGGRGPDRAGISRHDDRGGDHGRGRGPDRFQR